MPITYVNSFAHYGTQHMHILGNEKIICLPGLDGTGISFEPLRPFISKRADLTLVRYPDMAQSFHNIVEYAAKHISSIKGAVVIAESFSGPIAIELIATGRLHAKCLILCATFAKAPRPIALRISTYLPLKYILGFRIPDRLLRRGLGGTEFSDTLVPLFHRMKQSVSPEVLAHRIRLLNHVDVQKNFLTYRFHAVTFKPLTI